MYGTFNGSLTVRDKLVIHPGGKVIGKIRYGKVVIAEGGELSGEIQCAASGAAKPAATANKPSMQLAA